MHKLTLIAMMMQKAFAAPPADIGDNIANSIMLDSGASQYLSRTVGAPTNNLKWSFSAKVKIGKLGVSIPLLESPSVAGTYFVVGIFAEKVYISQVISSVDKGTVASAALTRDPTGWLDLLFVFDSANATANDRMQIYCNGVRLALSTNVAVALNQLSLINSASYAMNIGRFTAGSAFADGYIASAMFIDGYAMSPANFGHVSADTGQWVPSINIGSYGANGFKLDFTNGAALGTDSSGNGNNFTLNGSITSANQYTDTPTNNYCVLNQLNTSTITVSKGNLLASRLSIGFGWTRADLGVSSGKWYWEGSPISFSSSSQFDFGIATDSSNAAINNDSHIVNTVWTYFSLNGNKVNGSNPGTAYGSSYTTTDVIGIAFDADAGTLRFYKQTGGVGAFVDQGQAFTGLIGSVYFPMAGFDSNQTWSSALNFGQRPFNNSSVPTGFKALCTANLTSEVVTVSGTFTGNAAVDGPFVFCNGYPTTLTINSNAVTFGTHADRTANGFKLRTASASYNASGANTWTATIVDNRHNALKYANAQGNP